MASQRRAGELRVWGPLQASVLLAPPTVCSMVDFSKLRQQRGHTAPIDPAEIFLRLPKAPGIDDLWNSQAEALRNWFQRRTEKDLVIKLNTGGGKTLVGLLIAQSIINEHNGPVLYLSPNNLLVDQTLRMAKDYGLQAVRYVPGEDLDDRFLSGQRVMVATYAALFNGQSRFGLAGGQKDIVQVGGLILDDAHTAFTDMRAVFSISIDSGELSELYAELTHLFRPDFEALGRQGTFDDVVSGKDHFVLEVPYWSWLLRADEIRQRLSNIGNEKFPFQWPLVRDAFRLCHALVSSREVTITTLYPLVDMFPTFADCPRRVYMSATVADDSSIVRTFDASKESVLGPISPTSLAGVGERMILAPALTIIRRDELEGVVHELTRWVCNNFGGVVIITPSRRAADRWEAIAQIAQGDEVATCVNALVEGKDRGPYAFPNRYDGIDLPKESCRLLILDGLPRGTNVYDLYRAAVLEGSGVINATIAQRVEQGMGRGTRGAGDHCVVVITGNDLIAWISRPANLKLLTPSTRAQLEMGKELSRSIGDVKDLSEIVSKCLERAQDWTEYHAEVLADAAASPPVNVHNLAIAECERRFFRLVRDGYFEKAIAVVEKFTGDGENVSTQIRGWLVQHAARAATLWDNEPKAEELQRRAFALNRALLRPRVAPAYVRVAAPSEQSESIIKFLGSYEPRKGFLSLFEEVVDWLTPNASSNQFEESLRRLGEMLGFQSQRPDHEFGKGPDVLWVMSGHQAWVIEAKSQKHSANPLTKDEHGQLLEAFQWFCSEYPGFEGQKVVVHPNAVVTESVSATDSLALTLDSLLVLVTRARELFTDLCSSALPWQALTRECDRRLVELELSSSTLTRNLQPFSTPK